MTRTNNAPFTWKEIEDQVRTAIFCQFLSLQQYGPQDKALGDMFLGIDTDLLDPDLHRGQEHHGEAERSVPLERHFIHTIARAAYLYAYQCDGWQTATDETYHTACFLLGGAYSFTDTEGEHSPLSPLNDPPLRRMLETFVARWKLSNEEYHGGLTVRELALLSNMTVPAVRTSLSKEGFKLEATFRANAGKDENGALPEGDAIIWLSRRRGFVPTREEDATSPDMSSATASLSVWLETLPFDQALRMAFKELGAKHTALVDDFGKDAAWLEGLADGRNVAVDVTLLRKLAQHLGANEADFTAKAVQHLIHLDLLDDGKATV